MSKVAFWSLVNKETRFFPIFLRPMIIILISEEVLGYKHVEFGMSEGRYVHKQSKLFFGIVF